MRMIRNRCRITVRGPGIQLVLSMRPAESVPSPARARPAPTHSLRRLRMALGTWVAIEATAQSEAIAARAIEAAYAEVCEAARPEHPGRGGSDPARSTPGGLRRSTSQASA